VLGFPPEISLDRAVTVPSEHQMVAEDRYTTFDRVTDLIKLLVPTEQTGLDEVFPALPACRTIELCAQVIVHHVLLTLCGWR
jgi:hypothetical protein